MEFQSTLPQGERRCPGFESPHAHRISIHAPARGATDNTENCVVLLLISIHAPARGATIAKAVADYYGYISIHAPARGATPDGKRFSGRARYFNPRSRKGSDPKSPTYGAMCLDFNPRSRKGSDLAKSESGSQIWISIHAPARGATGEYLEIYAAVDMISIHAPARGATLQVRDLKS